MQVEKVIVPKDIRIVPQVYLTVLNATGRMRKTAKMGSHNFNPGAFMSPEPHGD
jgi:hypothetical protein